jgi:hypothetical protein
MPNRIPSDLGTILLAMKTQLVAQNVFPSASVWLSLTPEQISFPPDDQFCQICPETWRVDQSVVIGGGTDTFFVEGEVSVNLWSRVALDQTGRADDYLTSISLGALERLKILIAALMLYDPTDMTGNPILIEPMRLVSVAKPAFHKSISTDSIGRAHGVAQWVGGLGLIPSKWSVKWNQSIVAP